MQERMNYEFSQQQSRVLVINAFMKGVYRWMGLGLAVTAVVAGFALNYLKAMSAVELQQFMGTYGMLFMILLIAEIGLVVVLSAAIQKMSASTATAVFMGYCALSGLTLSVVLYGYAAGSILSAFIATTAMFGALSVYGMFTSKDLTSWGPILFAALIGLVVAMIINNIP